jgi:hypothetical protein
MLIRSQDKKRLINLKRVISVFIYDKAISKCDDPTWCRFELKADDGTSQPIKLGEYSTEAKAIKVLDMIGGEYSDSLYCDHVYDYAAQAEKPYIVVDNAVFQMPTDEEMEE